MWLVMNIGCIECGVSSAIVGVFADKKKAEAIASECDKKFGWREGGQNAFEVFEIPEPEKIADEYKDEVSNADCSPPSSHGTSAHRRQGAFKPAKTPSGSISRGKTLPAGR